MSLVFMTKIVSQSPHTECFQLDHRKDIGNQLESTQHILNRSRQIHNGRDPIQSEHEWLWIVSVGFFRATGGLESGVRNQQPYLLLVINKRWLSFTTCSGNYSLHVFERNAIWDRFITRVSEVDQDDSRVHIPKITFGV